LKFKFIYKTLKNTEGRHIQFVKFKFLHYFSQNPYVNFICKMICDATVSNHRSWACKNSYINFIILIL